MPIETLVETELVRSKLLHLDLPEDLHSAVSRHVSHLNLLAASLEAAGKNPEEIREMVADLLSSYRSDLVAVLRARP